MNDASSNVSTAANIDGLRRESTMLIQCAENALVGEAVLCLRRCWLAGVGLRLLLLDSLGQV